MCTTKMKTENKMSHTKYTQFSLVIYILELRELEFKVKESLMSHTDCDQNPIRTIPTSLSEHVY